MACLLVGADPLSEIKLEYCISDLINKLQWALKRIAYILIHENTFGSVVCEMAAVSSRPESAKTMCYDIEIYKKPFLQNDYIVLCTLPIYYT